MFLLVQANPHAETNAKQSQYFPVTIVLNPAPVAVYSARAANGVFSTRCGRSITLVYHGGLRSYCKP
jgi:hypothetical protein